MNGYAICKDKDSVILTFMTDDKNIVFHNRKAAIAFTRSIMRQYRKEQICQWSCLAAMILSFGLAYNALSHIGTRNKSIF